MRKILALVVAVIAASSCLYTVDRTEFVYLTLFGRHLRTFDGASAADAGLHLKWPWPIQSVQRLDHRLQYLDLPGAELMTRDRNRKTIDKTLTVDAYVCWRIADGEHVDAFVRSVGTIDGAKAILTQMVGSELGALVGELEMNDLVNTEANRVDARRQRVREELLKRTEATRAKYGIEVVDVRLRRINHPEAVRDAIYDRIRSERANLAADYESEGERLAANIRSESKRRVDELKSRGEAESKRLRGVADAEADKIRGETQRADPEFYAFLKILDAYKRMFGDGKTVLLLSTQRAIFDKFNNPPVPKK